MINPLDAAIVLVLAVSALASLWRGFMREALSLAGWALAAWVAITYSPRLASQLTDWVGIPQARAVLAFGASFVATLFAAALINHWLGRLIRASGLSGVDRALGGLFGLMRGGVVVVVGLVAGRLLALDQAPWWQASRLRRPFEGLAQWALSHLPQGLAPPLGVT